MALLLLVIFIDTSALLCSRDHSCLTRAKLLLRILPPFFSDQVSRHRTKDLFAPSCPLCTCMGRKRSTPNHDPCRLSRRRLRYKSILRAPSPPSALCIVFSITAWLRRTPGMPRTPYPIGRFPAGCPVAVIPHALLSPAPWRCLNVPFLSVGHQASSTELT